MRKFLQLVQESQRPALHAPHFAERVGEDVLGALLAAGVLEPIEPTWFPCGGPMGPGCPRRVVANPGDANHPHVAVCGQDFPACETVSLTASDVRRYTTTRSRFARVLRDLLTLEGEADLHSLAFPDTVQLGLLRRGHRAAEVFLCLRPATAGFPMFLAALQLRRRSSVVLVPTARGVPVDVAFRHSAGQKVELVFLEDVVVLRDGQLAVEWRDDTPPESTDRCAAEVPLCVALTNQGAQRLTRVEYEELRSRAETFDLFVDTLLAGEGGRYLASRREGAEVVREGLSAHEAAALIELVEARAPLRPAQIASFRQASIGHPEKVIEALRRKVDTRIGRFEWRSLHTLRGDTPDAKLYHFAPPAGLRFVLLRPLAEDERQGVSAGPGGRRSASAEPPVS